MLIIPNVISFTLLPAMLVLLTLDSAGQGLGVALFVITTLWTQILTTRFWAEGYCTLPLLDTSNAGFLYTHVQINDWLQIFSVVYAWFREIFFISLGAYLLQQSFSYFEDEDNESKESSIIDFILPFISWCALLQLYLYNNITYSSGREDGLVEQSFADYRSKCSESSYSLCCWRCWDL
jgi:hypothetical protein